MRQLPLNAKAYVMLDGSGNGTASTGPLSPGEAWSNITVSVRVATNVEARPSARPRRRSSDPRIFRRRHYVGLDW